MYRGLYLCCSFTINFPVSRVQTILLRLQNRSGRAMLLKTDEVDEALNITENKTNSITEIFFLKYYLELGLLHLPFWKCFSGYF